MGYAQETGLDLQNLSSHETGFYLKFYNLLLDRLRVWKRKALVRSLARRSVMFQALLISFKALRSRHFYFRSRLHWSYRNSSLGTGKPAVR